MYDVKFYCHNGMVIPVRERIGRGEASALVKRRNAYARRQGLVVAKVGGERNTWEHTGDDSCMMIGDDQGLLVVRKAERRGCRHGRKGGRK